MKARLKVMWLGVDGGVQIPVSDRGVVLGLLFPCDCLALLCVRTSRAGRCGAARSRGRGKGGPAATILAGRARWRAPEREQQDSRPSGRRRGPVGRSTSQSSVATKASTWASAVLALTAVAAGATAARTFTERELGRLSVFIIPCGASGFASALSAQPAPTQGARDGRQLGSRPNVEPSKSAG